MVMRTMTVGMRDFAVFAAVARHTPGSESGLAHALLQQGEDLVLEAEILAAR